MKAKRKNKTFKAQPASKVLSFSSMRRFSRQQYEEIFSILCFSQVSVCISVILHHNRTHLLSNTVRAFLSGSSSWPTWLLSVTLEKTSPSPTHSNVKARFAWMSSRSLLVQTSLELFEHVDRLEKERTTPTVKK